MREEIGREFEPHERELHDEVVVRLRAELGDGFDNARLEGAAMTRSEAMGLVVESLAGS